MTTDHFTHPWMSGLFDGSLIAPFWESSAQLTHYLAYEKAWARGLLAADLATPEAVAEAIRAIDAVDPQQPDLDMLRQGMAQDGVVIPALVRSLKEGLVTEDALHTGATTQDVLDTALSITLNSVSACLSETLSHVIRDVETLKTKFGSRRVMGVTRMQKALPISAEHRIDNWLAPLVSLRAELAAYEFPLQIGGAVGDHSKLGEAARPVIETVASELQLKLPDRNWHTDRSYLSAYAGLLTRLSATLGKFGKDVCLMALDPSGEISMTGAGGSSAMPHKQNPIKAELLVTLAAYSAGQNAMLSQSLVHEYERSGTSWSMEWLVFPALTSAVGCSLKTASTLASAITLLGKED